MAIHFCFHFSSPHSLDIRYNMREFIATYYIWNIINRLGCELVVKISSFFHQLNVIKNVKKITHLITIRKWWKLPIERYPGLNNRLLDKCIRELFIIIFHRPIRNNNKCYSEVNNRKPKTPELKYTHRNTPSIYEELICFWVTTLHFLPAYFI